MAHAVRKLSTAFRISAPKVTKSERQKHDGHLRFIRKLPCLVTGVYGVEAAHIRYGDMQYYKPDPGMGEKPSDMWVVPLSPEEHRRQHAMNEREYWTLAGINPLQIALLLWTNTGKADLCEQIIQNARKQP